MALSTHVSCWLEQTQAERTVPELRGGALEFPRKEKSGLQNHSEGKQNILIKNFTCSLSSQCTAK